MQAHRLSSSVRGSEICTGTRWPRPGRLGPLLSRVSLDHMTKMRWNETGKWIYSDEVVHPPIIGPPRHSYAADRSLYRYPRARHLQSAVAGQMTGAGVRGIN
jgi:hypothetical protein